MSLLPAIRLLAFSTAIAAAAESPLGQQLRQGPAPSDLTPMLRAFCMECHDAKTAEGDFDLETLLAQPEKLWNDGAVLDDLHALIRDGDMPPKKAKQKPSAAERERMQALLTSMVADLGKRTEGDPGVVVTARLTKHQYRNVMRDLSGGVVQDAGRFLPNEGGAGEGFANVGEAQSMTPAQLEKYIDAAKGTLRHLRASPSAGFIWRAVPRDGIDDPAHARAEALQDLIEWHVAQQHRWGRAHRDDLEERLGFSDALYLEAAWNYRWRAELGNPGADFSEVARSFEVPLAPVVLEKWFSILSAPEPKEPFADWARAWQNLPSPATGARVTGGPGIRQRCIGITRGDAAPAPAEEFAPPYEISFHEAREEVLAAAKEGRWPFRIAIGDAKELYLVATNGGDDGRGEYVVWRNGRIIFKDGTARPWQEAVKVIGANSGKPFPFGLDAENSAIKPGSIGARPPGALKFSVPEGALTFEVELAIDHRRSKTASIQALVSKEKPKSQSYIPGRPVFGGKTIATPAAKQDAKARELNRALRRRNVSEANVTKVGLSSERNILAEWTRVPLRYHGGPWPDHAEDREEPLAPYHMTVAQARRNATAEDLAALRALEDHLVAIAQIPQQEALALAKAAGWEMAREGRVPPAEALANWSDDARAAFAGLRARWETDERALEEKTAPLLAEFARRAWRRPLADAEHGLLLSLYRESRAQGFSYDSAVKEPLLLVLASPHFLYRLGESAALAASSGSEQPERRQLSSEALASRLSFFLWSSIPDDELLAAAAANRLQDPAVLGSQAARMLRDPRARSLATDFAAQLWDYADFEAFSGPDGERFKDFTPELRQAMLDEVTHFIGDLIQNDRPLSALLDADYTFANHLLAKHYGLEAGHGATGRDSQSETIPVRRPVSPSRGGLATMGLFLAKTSLPLRTSPVQRGVWLMEKLLGRELPNPPPEVPPLSADEKDAGGLSIRQQLEKHRAEASCASCHDKIDPLGVSLENFDAIGRWRATERDGSPLATSATTHDGVELDGVAGLKKYLLGRQDEFFRHFSRKLLGYALGRAVLPGDNALLDRMRAAGTRSGHRFSSLVEEIVTSPQFTQRRAAAPVQTTASP